MAIQMRRGQEVNFDADKMLPGEWAVSLDTKYVRMCFAPGVCVRMATYDAFEVDMAKIEAILAECQTIEEVVTRINTEVSANAKAVAEYTSQAKQYRDEAKLYKEQASAIVGVDIATKEIAGLVKGGDNAISEDGTLMLTRTTTSRTLTESQNGGIRIISMDGESQQNGTPTPNAKVDINSAKISEIWSHGKNFWNLGDISGTLSVAKGFNLEVGTYTISALVTSSDTDATTCLLQISCEDGTKKSLYFEKNSRKSKNITLTSKAITFNFYASTDYSKSQGDTFSFKDIQIEKGSVATPFEEFKETRETLSAPIVLRSIGSAKDVLFKVNGVYSVLRNIYNDTYKGGSSETWYKPTSANAYRIINSLTSVPPNNNTVTNAICSRFISDTINKIYNTALDMNGKFGIGTSGEIVFRKDDITTLEAWKSWITSNNVTIQGVLKTPTFEPLPLADQIALHKLESFGGVAYLFTDSTIEPIIEVEYGTSKVGGYAIKGLNSGEISLLELEQLKTLTNELATQIVAGSEA